MVVRVAGLALLLRPLVDIFGFLHVGESHLLDGSVAALCKLDRSRYFANESAVGQIFASAGHAFHIEITREMSFKVAGRSGISDFAQMIEDKPEQHGCMFRKIRIDS